MIVLAFEVSAPRVVGQKYVLVELIGLGSMGEVWAAHHIGLEKACAVKLMVREEHEPNDAALARFAREAQLAAALSRKTRHIAPVTDYGIDEHGPYLVMDLLEGEALEARLTRGCTPREVSDIVQQIAKGLAVAHREGVIHRDLKPANVFLTRTEEGDVLVMLLDFGIARLMEPTAASLTINGVVVGSPGYMSPEHVLGEKLDARADVWSLAVVAFEVLTGVLPFGEESIERTMSRIRAFEAQPLRSVLPGASSELEAVFTRAFTPNIADRFQSADEFAHALAVAARTQRRPWIRIALAAALCAFALVLGAIVFARHEPPHATTPVLAVKALAPAPTATSHDQPTVSVADELPAAPTPSPSAKRPSPMPSATMSTPSATPSTTPMPSTTVDPSTVF